MAASEIQTPSTPDSTPTPSAAPQVVKVYGVELVLIGIVGFIAILTFTILTYKVFIRDRVKKSEEYNTATFYVVNSETLREQLLSPMESMEFRDIEVTEREDYGICEITFDLHLKNDLVEVLKIGLVKVSDFWIVYEAKLSPNTPAAYLLVSTYQKVIMMLDRLSYQDSTTAQMMIELIRKEIRDPNLFEYLNARVNAIAGNSIYAKQILDDLQHRVENSVLAVKYERAMIHFTDLDYTKALEVFAEIIAEYDRTSVEDESYKPESIFDGLPKDPLIASFNHDNILADTYQNMALAHYNLAQYEEGIRYAEMAITKAEDTDSNSVLSTAMFVKGLNLFRLKRFDDADSVFSDVIADLDNTNLSQKAWAYYYRADIASRFSRNRESLDYYETAVGLDPFNYLIRQGAIEYLVNRNQAGDYEIALGFAIRGVDYEVEKSYFKEKAAQLFQLLSLPDKTRSFN